jgi:hypothetical protein
MVGEETPVPGREREKCERTTACGQAWFAAMRSHAGDLRGD